MQEGYVFSDTIAGNIGVSDDRPDMERVRRATRIANIDTFIDAACPWATTPRSAPTDTD